MPQPPLRFLQSGDFHLESPLHGVSEIPTALRELFLEAPYRAVEQVFETALVEEVDALLLCGDLVDVERAGPRALVFLTRQFTRLAEHNIQVYWAGGSTDPPDAWPRSVALPSNVHLFPLGRVESYEHQRQGVTVARIQGTSRTPGRVMDDSGFHRDVGGLFTVGVSHGTAASPGAEGDRVHYMALGGQHRRQTVDQSPGIAHFSGTPQGRIPDEVGAHGCTLVSVDESGHVKAKFVATDAIRWIQETIEITAGTTRGELLELMHDRANKVRSNHPDRELLLQWRVQGRGDLVNGLRRGGLSDEVVAQLRTRYAQASPALWSVGLHCDEALDCPEEWYDQETILGDMLRQFRNLTDDENPWELADFLPASQRQGPHSDLADLPVGERRRLLLGAAKLGLDLVRVADPGVDADE